MTIQQFIEKAIEGGWNPRRGEKQYTAPRPPHHICLFSEYHPFLDAEAWKAVGKVEGWGPGTRVELGGGFWTEDMWLKNMHRMIDALAEGKTIEEFLATL